ncbi:MAG: DUF928 domain-containing protein [Symploca sp. SIO2E6]|nr:DUF928 domain-containing protein [Symploca sp. SIO2E6]
MKKYFKHGKLLALALSVGLAVSSLPVIASIKHHPRTQSSPDVSENLMALRFKVRRVRYSRRRTGGLSRGSKECNGDLVSVTPLWPNSGSEEEKTQTEVESTVDSNPTFFVHLSHESTQEAEFLLLKEQDGNQEQIIHEEILELTSNPTGNSRILALSLPSDGEKQLEVGKYYHWMFSVMCDEEDSSKNVVVDGWVQRIPPDTDNLETELAQTEPRNHPDIYAERGIWPDTLMVLANLRQQYPNDVQLKEKWETLLKSVGLDEAIATQTP